VIASPQAAEGIDAQSGIELQVANNAKEFEQVVLTL